MTTRAELLELAKKHKATSSILVAIEEARTKQDIAFSGLQTSLQQIAYVRSISEYCGTYVEPTSTQMLAEALKFEESRANMWTLFFTLACMLQELGEDINY